MGKQTKALLAISMIAIIVRTGVMLYPHSGENRPPMYGDYEAQRHWMEITVNLDVSEWYQQTERNDLQYWGLDYPPLTAWHSKVLGWVARLLEPDSMALDDSRGYSTPSSKLFMRLSVLFTDVLLYFTGAAAFCLTYSSQPTLHYAILVLQPAIILIDHGHFQYNTVSLGLTLWAVVAMIRGHELTGSMLYCLALNHKQMSLYHAPAISVYLLGKALQRKNNRVWGVLCLVLVVLVTFTLLWIPSGPPSHILGRIFPFNRGLFEDKVASFWCAASPVLRIREWFPRNEQVLLCLFVTAVSLVPACWRTLRKPTHSNLIISMTASALSFFLFSFQVHEKSVLLVLLPASMYWSNAKKSVSGLVMIGTFSMWPLIYKDDLVLAYIACMMIYIVINGVVWQSAFVVLLGHCIWGFVVHPSYPDIASLGIAGLSATVFMGAWFVCSFCKL